MKLLSLIEAVGRRVKALDLVARRTASLPQSDFERERLATFLAIDLSNLNAGWIRRYYIAVSTNEAFRKTGRKIVIGRKHQSIEEAIAYAIDKLNRPEAKLRWTAAPTRFLEPSWASVNTLPQLANMLSFPDRQQIGTTISAGRDALNTLRAARNYYAHRNTDSRRALVDAFDDFFGWQVAGRPSEYILNKRIGPFPSVYSFWLDDTTRMAHEVCDL